MEHALKLIVDGAITIASIEEDRGMKRRVKPIPQLNPGTGKVSNHNVSFSAATWGKATRSWTKNALINLNEPDKVAKVIQEARVFERAAARRLAGRESGSDDDERVLLSDLPISDDD